jgi:hypothetical protein
LHKKRILFSVACAFLILLSMTALGEKLPSPTAAATKAPVAVTNPDITLDVELGYFGSVTYMRDIPFTVTVENKGPDIEGTIGVDLNRNDRFFDRCEYPISLASGSKKRIVLPVNLKMTQSSYVIELVSGGSVLTSVVKKPDRTIRPEAVLIGVLSPDPQSLSYMNQDSLSRIWADRYEGWQLVALDADRFPQNDSLMSSFMILVVDGFDVSTLSPAQQQTLDRWLENGGIVMVGGGAQAATDYPYFSKYTSLTAGSLAETEDITPALIQYFAFGGDKPLNQPVQLNEAGTNDTPLVSSDSHPLIYKHQAGSGLIYTTAFELGAKPLTGWSGMSVLWPRVLVNSANSQYTSLYNRITGKLYGGSYATYLLNDVPIKSSGSTVPVVIFLAVYLILAGAGSYFLLKRLDKREWMWLTVPVLAFICMAVLFFMSQSLPFNKPAVASFTSIRMNPQGETQVNSIADLASPDTGEVMVKGEDGIQLTPVDESTYFYDDPLAEKAPKQQLYRMVFGDAPAVGYPEGAPWKLRQMSLSGGLPAAYKLSGRLWMQEDGMHGEIVNDTPYTFKDGIVITNLGYARVGELMPGASGQITLLKPKEEKKVSSLAGSVSIYETPIQEGVMISSSIIRPNDMDLYPFIRAAIYPEEQTGNPNNSSFRSTLNRDELALRSFKENAIQQVVNNNPSGSASWVSPFHFVAFQDEIGQTKLFLNGQEVTKHGHQAVVDVLLSYEPIGPTGVVYYPIGTLPAYPVLMNVDGSFAEPEAKAVDPNISYQLAQQPMFCFTMPDTTKLTVDSLSILATSYDTVPTMQMYNQKTQMWEEQSTLYVMFTDKQILPFISPEGRVYLRFMPGTSSRDYDSVLVPSISLEGRMK